VSHPVKTVILAAADAEPILEPPIENKVPETDKGELEDKPAVTFHHEDAPRVPRAILSDICARSGGIKRFTSHGRRWHCEYSRR
jgi:hypothetical protein